VELLTSRLLADLPHGFTTRHGGISAPPYDALNLGDQVGDDAGAVAENWRRLERLTGLAYARVRQVHGTRVLAAVGPSGPSSEADGVLSDRPEVAACVAVADCVPILLASRDGRAVAALHAGWRGTLGLVAQVGAEALARVGGEAVSQLRAVLGPAIGPCCYQVSEELAVRFEAAFGAVVSRSGRAVRLDLWRANRTALEHAGVGAVEVLERCTACEPGTFFSHRRDGGRTGRMVAFAAPRAISAGRALP
jgi:polyphenol oxidase